MGVRKENNDACYFPFLFIFSISINIGDTADCPGGWIYADSECYHWSPTTLNWFQAQEHCWENNAFLAEIKTERQQKSLEAILMQDIHYWIGLNDIANEGTFRWAESHQMLEYSNWNAGQPDDAEYYDGEDCVHISGKSGHNYKWNDLHCTWTGIWDIPTHALCQLNQ